MVISVAADNTWPVALVARQQERKGFSFQKRRSDNAPTHAAALSFNIIKTKILTRLYRQRACSHSEYPQSNFRL